MDSFNPIVTNNSKILILGSYPSIKSFEKSQYYANPKNKFWDIIQDILNCNKDLNYDERVELIKNNNIALWDVVKRCQRDGSLDNNIIKETIVYNDIEQLLIDYQSIKSILCNGNAAFTLIKKSNLLETFLDIKIYKLPSTSPAYAKLPYNEKLKEWSILKDIL